MLCDYPTTCVMCAFFPCFSCTSSRQPINSSAPCRLRVEKGPFCFLARCHKRRLNRALSVLSLSIGLWVNFAVYWGHFLSIVSLRLYVFCLLVVLVKLSVLNKWLARKTPLKTPIHDKEIISTKSGPKSVYDFFKCIVFHCFTVCCLVPWPYAIYFILLWHDVACFCWKCR